MNLVQYGINDTIHGILKERYYNSSYRTLADMADVRRRLIQEHRFESVRVRETPGSQKISSWELRVMGRTYFYDYHHSTQTLQFVGVR